MDWDLVDWSEDGLFVGDRNTEPIWEQQIFESYLAPYPLADNDEPVFPDYVKARIKEEYVRMHCDA